MERSSDAFVRSRQLFEGVAGFLEGRGAGGLTHAQLEDELAGRGRELLRQLMQDHLALRAAREARVVVRAADGAPRSTVETARPRQLATVFGEVTHTRMAYRTRGLATLHPADAQLNLPPERHSHGLRRLAAVECARGSFDDATEVIRRATGCGLGKRQVEQLACRAASDVEDFYATRERDPVAASDVLVLSVDGKGIVMRPEALRAPTAARAASAKLATRLSKGEKRNRKRMAEVGAVYDVTPAARGPQDVIAPSDDREPAPAPRARNKWLNASVVHNAAEVIGRVFDEAERRDPARKRTWLALVDGNNHQIDRVLAEADQRNADVAVLIDFVHVIEYVWSAAWSFHHEGDPAAETWVKTRLLAILDGNAAAVATNIRRQATRRKLTPAERANADRCATYLTNKRDHLDYPTALREGWPIATGVIEGACRHLVKDRMDITGARWGLAGAEAVLTLRALRSNGDFDQYWTYHLQQEHQRIHQARYTDGLIPETAAA